MTENRDARSVREIDVLDEIRAELSAVRPSPEFAARVRARIADDRPVRAWGLNLDWRWLLPATVAAIAMVVGLVSWRSGSDLPDERTIPVVAEAQPTVQLGPAAARPNAKAETRQPSGRRLVAEIRATDLDTVPEVITNQRAVLKALWANVPSVIHAAQTESIPVEIPDLTVAPVEVKPIVVKWMGEPVDAPGGVPIIRRVSADAERSEK